MKGADMGETPPPAAAVGPHSASRLWHALLHDVLPPFVPLARRVCPPLVLLALFAAGAWQWCDFYRWGKVSLLYLDNPKEADYNAVLRDALTRGQVPFHYSKSHQGTDRFFGLPETN